MKIKDKVKTYSFWVSLTSAIILILKLISTQLGFSFDEKFASDLITTLCSILVILGIIVTPNASAEQNVKTDKLSGNVINTKEKTETTETDEVVFDETTISDNTSLTETEAENSAEAKGEFGGFVIVETEQAASLETPQDKTLEFENLLNMKKQEFSDDINNYLNVLQTQINSINNPNNE